MPKPSRMVVPGEPFTDYSNKYKEYGGPRIGEDLPPTPPSGATRSPRRSDVTANQDPRLLAMRRRALRRRVRSSLDLDSIPNLTSAERSSLKERTRLLRLASNAPRRERREALRRANADLAALVSDVVDRLSGSAEETDRALRVISGGPGA